MARFVQCDPNKLLLLCSPLRAMPHEGLNLYHVWWMVVPIAANLTNTLTINTCPT